MQLWMKGDWVEIRRSDITLEDKLGEGAFGEAYKGLVRMDGKVKECAVKKLKGKDCELTICQSRKCLSSSNNFTKELQISFFKVILSFHN